MTVWLAGSRSATAARMATVFPVPTSPVTMQIVLSATAQAMRAAASPPPWGRGRLAGGGGRGGVRGAGDEQPGAADRAGRVGAVVAAEPAGGEGGCEPPADLGQQL